MRSEDDLRRLADRSFCPVYLRAATAYGVSPLLRFDLAVNNLVAWAATTGRVFLKSLGTSWRPLVHIEDIAQAYVTLLRAPEEKVHNQRLQHRPAPTRTTGSATSPSWCARSCRTRGSSSPPTPSPIMRNYRVNCDLIRSTCRTTGRTGRWPRASREVYEAIADTGGSAATTSRARATTGSPTSSSLMADGRVDEDLRWADRSAPPRPEPGAPR